LEPEQRAALMANATAHIRGAKRTHQDLCNRAVGKQRTAKLSGDESVIFDALVSNGLHPVPLLAVDKYNIDFGFADARLAVEYHGGNWHNTPAKRAQVEAKRSFLTANGWRVLEVPRLDKPQANNAGNRRMQVGEIVAMVQAHLSPHQRGIETD
jgi:very-short-patch-repair endonuclease